MLCASTNEIAGWCGITLPSSHLNLQDPIRGTPWGDH